MPSHAVEAHTASLMPLLTSALSHLPLHKEPRSPTQSSLPPLTDHKGVQRRRPDFVSVTRGPGMGSSLAVGLNTAKGLAAAWGVPLVAVHHMQAHALTPRLANALERADATSTLDASKKQPSHHGHHLLPRFPFATLLVSGGHTTLLDSSSLTSHRVIAHTDSIAVGDALDKAARMILPAYALSTCSDTMYARALEEFAFPGTTSLSPSPLVGRRRFASHDESYSPPVSRSDEDRPVRHPDYNWFLSPPLADSRRMAFNYSGLGGQLKNLVKQRTRPGEKDMDMDIAERRALAACVMRVAFDHLASRVVMMLQSRDTQSKHYYRNNPVSSRRGQKFFPPQDPAMAPINHLVVSGGVASNKFLMHVLRRFLTERGYGHVMITAPPVELCTDNAAMIAWAGMEMYEAGWVSDPGVLATPQWSMDAAVEGGGVVEVVSWKRRSE